MKIELGNRGCRIATILIVALFCVGGASGARRARIVKAAEVGNTARIAKEYPKASGQDWLNALNAAISGGHLQAVRWLIGNGPKLGDEVCDKKGHACEPALPSFYLLFHEDASAIMADRELWLTILASTKTSGRDWLDALNAAITVGHLQALQWLMDNGPKLGDEVCDKKGGACGPALPDVTRLFNRGGPAIMAADRGLWLTILASTFEAMEESLVQHEASLVLFSAVSDTDVETVEFLLSRGANPNQQLRASRLIVHGDGQGSYTLRLGVDKRGLTLLGAAVREGKADMTSLLLKSGADLDTPFIWKRWKMMNSFFFPEILEAQLRSGKTLSLAGSGPPKFEQAEFTTPLILATQLGNLQIVTSLLSSGADVTGTDEKGLTAIMHAEQKAQSEILDALNGPRLKSVRGDLSVRGGRSLPTPKNWRHSGVWVIGIITKLTSE